MVSQSQSEIKKLLTNQLKLEITKNILSLVTGISATILIPLGYNSIEKTLDKTINLCGFLGGISCFTYSYFSSNKIKEYSGKLAMFKELEKTRFIQEQVILQENYLSQLNNQMLPVFSNAIDCQSQIISQTVSQSETNHSLTSDNQSDNISQTVSQDQSMICCPQCQSININKNGKRDNYQKFICKDCDHNFQIELTEV